MNIDVDTQVLDNMPENVKEAINKTLEQAQLEVWGNLKKYTPVDHGRAANSWQLQTRSDVERIIYNTAEYVKHLIEGTGIYGPTKQPIMPVTAKALKFEWKGKTFIFKGDLTEQWQKASFIKWAEERDMTPVLKWPDGIEPHDFVDRSIEEAESRIPEFLNVSINKAFE